jgi:geranylgeranyl pyrophosphate synthase
LLLAKVVEVPKTSPQFKFSLDLQKSGFLKKQLLLAETIELIHGGCTFHTIGISPIGDSSSHKQNTLLQGNRLSILRGDLMFSTATKNLVKLKYSRVTDMMSKSLREFVEGEYLNIKIKEKIESGDWTDILEDWYRMTFLKNASLIANGCQSMIHLSGNCESIEESVYKFGNNVGFAWTLVDELDLFNQFQNNSNNEVNDTALSIPILLHINSHPEFKTRLSESTKISFFKDVSLYSFN